ncbi:hypothetical protein [Ornithinibacillus contaminans]|nr:hypothetical protein [Ornithinibacillus contaminans]
MKQLMIGLVGITMVVSGCAQITVTESREEEQIANEKAKKK